MIWHLGDRVEQSSYGAGTVIEADDQHIVVHFDRCGRRKFSAHLVQLTKSQQPAPRAAVRPHSIAPLPRASMKRTMRDPGYENPQRQTVVRATDTPGSIRGQQVYVLRCGRCGAHYGANGSDIDTRSCPRCMDGDPGVQY